MKQYYIYMTTNLINGKKYIGKHYGEINDSYLGSGKLLKRAIEKYGKENFLREILDFSKDEEENCEKEKYYIALYDAVHNDMFYNIHEGGNGGNTIGGWTLEEKLAYSKKLSVARSGQNGSMWGKHHSQETKNYLSYYATYVRDNSVYRTKEFKEKISNCTAGEHNGMYGKRHTEESKKKMSENRKGLTCGEKNGMYGKTGIHAINGNRIAKMDSEGNIIEEFNTTQLALKSLGLKGHTGLDKAIKNNTEYKGFYWKKLGRSVETN